MICPCCNHQIADEIIVKAAASINGKKGTNKGGARKGAGRPSKIQTLYRAGDDGTWWVDYKPGWKSANDPLGCVHGDHEDTKAEITRCIADAVPCDCDECVKLAARSN